MPRDSHYCARSVGHEHIISDPYRNSLPIDRIDCVPAGKYSRLIFFRRFALDVSLSYRLVHVIMHLVALFWGGDLFHQRMLRRQDHKCGAPQSVRTSCEHLDPITSLGTKNHGRAFGFTDPIGLQGLHTFRPIHSREIQQFFSIIGSPEKPLFQVFLDYRSAAALAVAVLSPHLFTR